MSRIAAAALLMTLLSACSSDNKGKEQTPATVSASSNAQSLLDGLTEPDRKTFAGGGKIGGPIATISVPQTKDEITWLDTGDIDAFVRAAKRSYPDISRVRFSPDADMKDDAETVKMYRNSFYAGLYFAKQIKTGDGSTLFNLLTKCGRLKDPTSGADMSPPLGEHKVTWVHLQFFPIFRRLESDDTTDLQVLFDREGNKITATSPLFSSHVLAGNSFMADHGVRCF